VDARRPFPSPSPHEPRHGGQSAGQLERPRLARSASSSIPTRRRQTVANFLEYVKSGHYDGTQFHRVIGGFMVQGGGFTGDFQQKPTRAPMPIESGA
jgi:peptidyl-prolyl cis-trans isomerase A (cyclophilin A)